MAEREVREFRIVNRTRVWMNISTEKENAAEEKDQTWSRHKCIPLVKQSGWRLEFGRISMLMDMPLAYRRTPGINADKYLQ